MMIFHVKECYYSVILDMAAVIRIFFYFVVDQYMVTCNKIAECKV